jgi:3-dehydroquinate synthase
VPTIPVRTPSAAYDVVLEQEILPSLHRRLHAIFGPHRRRFFVITSPEIWTLWSERFLASFLAPAENEPSPAVLLVPAGEEHKRLPSLERLAEELARAGADRNSVLLAFGGGVIGDITGFLAAVFMRGIDYVQIPTTLLAQVDSSIGGKTGVNLAAGKNLIGSFHHPRLVLADPVLLSTLPPAELRAGLFESLKAGLIRDPALFAFMERERPSLLAADTAALLRVVAESVKVKAAVVAADERESGERMILNFGHTIGHAIEAATGYTTLLHGEAVGWGMRVAIAASRKRGLLSAEEDSRVLACIDAYGLPALPRLSPSAMLAAAAGDKKNRGGVRRFVLLKSIGHAVVVDDLSDNELLAAIASGLTLDGQ